MKLDYQQTYKKEILTEFASSIYAKVVNLVVDQELNIHDESHFLVKLMHQLVIMDAHSLGELETIQAYWQAMNNFIDSLPTKSKVA